MLEGDQDQEVCVRPFERSGGAEHDVVMSRFPFPRLQ